MRCVPWLLTFLIAAGGALAADPAPVGLDPSSPPELEIEGIRLGLTFADVDAMLDLDRLEPMPTDRGESYTWHPEIDPGGRFPPTEGYVPIPEARIEADGAGRVLRSLQVEMGKGRVIGVVATYATDVRSSGIGPELVALYGEPTWIRRGKPRELSGAQGESVTQRVQVWHWDWAGASLEVIAESYSSERGGAEIHRPPGVTPVGTRSFFHFRLSDRGE